MRILLINPNSDREMTEDMKRIVSAFEREDLEIVCVTNVTGPHFIETYEDVYRTAEGVLQILKEQKNYDGVVIACHGDPNVDLYREMTDKPVIGIAEASMKMASMLGHKFSVIGTDPHSNPSKEDLVRRYNLADALASIEAPENPLTLNDVEGYSGLIQRAIGSGAEVVVLGCSGLSAIRDELQERNRIPIIDSVQSGVAIVEGLIKMGVSISKVRKYNPDY